MRPVDRTTPRVAAALLCAALLWPAQPALAQFTQQVKLFGIGAVGNAAEGGSVALSGDGNTAIVGGGLDNNQAGAAWVFARSGGTWSQQAKLFGAGAIGAAVQGFSVALSSDGSTAIMGGPVEAPSEAPCLIDSGSSWV